MSHLATKPCRKCGASDRYTDGRCRPCRQRSSAKWSTNNLDRAKKKRAEWRANNKEHLLEYRLNREYQMSLQEWKVRFETQNGLCLICKKDPPVAVDHCHNTKEVRGLLCHFCNVGLGFFKDDIRLLQNAIEYLDRK